MKVIVFVGGNKSFSADRLGVKVAETLAVRGLDARVWGVKGKLKTRTFVPVKEYSAVSKPKTLAAGLQKEGAEFVVSLMNLAGCRAALEAGVPFVYAETEDFKEDSAVKDKKTVLKQAKRVFVLKTTDKPLNKKAYAGLKPQETCWPALGVEHDGSARPACFKKENNLVACGKLVKENNFALLLEAWAELAPLHPTWHLTVMGDGTAKTALKKFIAKHGLESSVELVPDDGSADVLLRAADIFVCPGVARADLLLEAMASKLPCVACDGEAARRLLVSGVNGVIAPDTAQGLARALDGVMVDWGWRVGLALEAAKTKDKYPLENFAGALAALLV